MKKSRERLQCNCGRKRAHLGYRPHHTLTSVGKIKTRRLYCGCVLCKLNVHPTDALLGIEDDYSVGLRDLAVFAAADSSFAKAEKRLKKFCGISISENTIKMLCDLISVLRLRQWKIKPRSVAGGLRGHTDCISEIGWTRCRRWAMVPIGFGMRVSEHSARRRKT